MCWRAARRTSTRPGTTFRPKREFMTAFVNVAAGDYSLVPGTPFRTSATDGGALGADMARVNAALTGAAVRRLPVPTGVIGAGRRAVGAAVCRNPLSCPAADPVFDARDAEHSARRWRHVGVANSLEFPDAHARHAGDRCGRRNRARPDPPPRRKQAVRSSPSISRRSIRRCVRFVAREFTGSITDARAARARPRRSSKSISSSTSPRCCRRAPSSRRSPPTRSTSTARCACSSSPSTKASRTAVRSCSSIRHRLRRTVFRMSRRRARAGRVSEDQFNTPQTMYGCNKLYCEQLGRYYARYYKQLAGGHRPARRFPRGPVPRPDLGGDRAVGRDVRLRAGDDPRGGPGRAL